MIIDTLYKFSITRIPTNWILKRTMFKHFCGGEALHPEVIATVRRLKNNCGVNSILEYSMEADISPGDKNVAESIEKVRISQALIQKSIGGSYVSYFRRCGA
jgi:hypothetical protein